MKTTTNKLVISIVALLMLFNVLNAQQLRVLCTAVVMSEPVPTSIIIQPADTSLCAGSNAMFFISAIGDEPILYQWQKNGVDIVGAVNDTLFVTNIVASDTGQYRCIVNNACGGDTSDVANLTLCPCIVNIPDANFKNYLINNSTINTNADSEIQCSEATTFTGSIDVSNSDISDLTGIEAFSTLTTLNCSNNPIASIDVSANIMLTNLACYATDIVSLSLNSNTVLSQLECSSNYLSELDLTSNTQLEILYCHQNQLTSLNLSTNTNLIDLNCQFNQITELDLSNNFLIANLDCSNNLLDSLNLLLNSNLVMLNCSNNQIDSLSLSANLSLSQLYCFSNFIPELDLKANSLIYVLDCRNNLLNSLLLDNGNNSNFSWFDATSNPALTCIQVDNATWSTANWTNIDVWASFSEDCILFNLIPEQPIAFDTSRCGTGDITLQAQGGQIGEKYKWYDSSVGGTLLFTDSVTSNGMISYLTINLSTTTSYFVAIDSMGVESPRSIATAYIYNQASLNFSPVNNASCGTSSGSATCIPTGGTNPYSFLWSNSSISATALGLSFGYHSVTVTDANYCESEDSVLILNSSGYPSSIVSSQTNVSCFGGNNGSATIISSGGVSPYSYVWNNGQTTNIGTILNAGTYSVTVTGSNNCSSIIYLTIAEPAQLQVVKLITNVNCFGLNTGVIDITPSGGFEPYVYSWSNGATTQDIGGLPAGVYSLIFTDNNSCSLTDNITITQPLALLPSILSQTNVSCNGDNNGSATVIVAGGTAPYTYSWTGGGTTATVSSLVAGIYVVTVTDANSCTAIASVTITQPASILSQAIIATHILCFGEITGSVNLIPVGGTAPYTYLWNNTVTNEDLSNISAGVYSVTITDNNSCTSIATTTINQPAMALTANAGSDQAICLGNNANLGVVATGGTGAYTYNWSPSATLNDANSQYPVSNTLVNELYTVTVSDANGCTATDNVQVSVMSAILVDAGVDQNTSSSSVTLSGSVFGGTTTGIWSTSGDGTFIPDNTNLNAIYTFGSVDIAAGFVTLYLISTNNGACNAINDSVVITITNNYLTSTFSTTNVDCFGNNSGAINLSVTGGQLPYNYLWSNGQTTEDISLLSVGMYYVTITDALASSLIDSVEIFEPTEIILYFSQFSHVTCFGNNDGQIIANATGGIQPYSFNWSNSINDTIISNLSPFYYEVTVTDANGCQALVGDTIHEPMTLTLWFSEFSHISCNGANDGQIIANATGGTQPYSFNWSNSINDTIISNLSAGYYEVTISDINNCQTILGDTIDNPSPILIWFPNYSNISCFGLYDGFIVASATGGVQPYNYEWSNGFITESISDLSVDTYYITITDANGCNKNDSISISEPEEILLSINVTNETCSGYADGSASVIASGGVTPYVYNWSNGIQTETISNLTSGVYYVTVTDANLCSNISSEVINSSTTIFLTETVTNVSCNGLTNGQIVVNPSGGIEPYLYTWSNGADSDTLINLSAGNYYLTVSDANNCYVIASYSIIQPNAITATVNKTPASCDLLCNGTAQLTVSGGNSPYLFNWSSGETVNPAIMLCPGINVITITDANVCQKIYNVQILTEPTSIINGIIQYSGGTIPVNSAIVQLWKNTSNSSSGKVKISEIHNVANGVFQFSNLLAGTYFIKVKVIEQTSFPNLLPTYYDSVHQWFNASSINLVCNTTESININMLEVPSAQMGNGNISGKLSLINYNKSIMGEPVPGADITLEQEPDDEPISSSTSNYEGKYSFNNIASGVYTIKVDIPGIPQFETDTIAYIGNDTTFLGINFIVDTSSVNMGIYLDPQTYNETLFNKINAINIYPNPFSEKINIELNLNSHSKVKIDLYSIEGEKIQSLFISSKKNNHIAKEFDIKDLTPGVYLLHVKVDNTTIIKKIVKSN